MCPEPKIGVSRLSIPKFLVGITKILSAQFEIILYESKTLYEYANPSPSLIRYPLPRVFIKLTTSHKRIL